MHASTVLVERSIQLEWLERVLTYPERSEPHPLDPALRHAIGPIAENGARYLRVIYNPTSTPWRIVTAYFDRTLRSER